MPQGTGTTVKEVAGVDPEVKTNIRKVAILHFTGTEGNYIDIYTNK